MLDLDNAEKTRIVRKTTGARILNSTAPSSRRTERSSRSNLVIFFETCCECTCCVAPHMHSLSSRRTERSYRSNLLIFYETSKECWSYSPGLTSIHTRMWYGFSTLGEDDIGNDVCFGLAICGRGFLEFLLTFPLRICLIHRSSEPKIETVD